MPETKDCSVSFYRLFGEVGVTLYSYLSIILGHKNSDQEQHNYSNLQVLGPFHTFHILKETKVSSQSSSWQNLDWMGTSPVPSFFFAQHCLICVTLADEMSVWKSCILWIILDLISSRFFNPLPLLERLLKIQCLSWENSQHYFRDVTTGFLCNTTPEELVQKFHTDDISIPRSG